MPQELNQSLRPPGGYFFIDSDGVRHESSGVNNLANALARYRIGLGRPPGNPLAEVTAQICKRAPTHCTGEPDAAGEVPEYDAKQFATLVAAGIRNDVIKYSRTPLAKVKPEVAVARLAICARCPGRVNWVEGCAPCQKSVAGLVEQTISPQAPIPGSEVLACLGDARCLGTEAHKATPAKLTHPDAPGNCWRKAQ